mmetsp:Transcript_78901/g.124577  ORF Transcript_78901/g.124577 Transcript_78901/m.124577 type:complete len:180 (-) Transcript_78901:233-772(-)|eukprot:CAMPEP_0169278224 /NCGR_PEP_ID=MMETSP1016-20121227/54189_1 /TAXON_ID=342587 /ORGANISM="Karlodinium micrum, Strain CCMP2283" /LENGTH=179 /DNA_ID=CAMNT_0009365927 /DNA_START=1 /DNA_END=540 /DNA_ORIENTATION=+
MGNSLDSQCCQCEPEASAPMGVPTYPAYPGAGNWDNQAPGAVSSTRPTTELTCPAAPDPLGQVQAYHAVLSPPPAAETENDMRGGGLSAIPEKHIATNLTTSSIAKPLPRGWIKMVSKSTGKEYYYNEETGKSTFAFPDEEPPDRELPEGWCEKQSRSTGKIYYWNEALQKSQFDFPTE